MYHLGYNTSVSLWCREERRHRYLLHNLTIVEDVLNGHVEFSEVVFAHTIFVPADRFEKKALCTNHGKVEGDVPFWIKVLADNRRRFLRVAQCDNQELKYSLISIATLEIFGGGVQGH